MEQIYCDKKSVAQNLSVPESTLSERHNAICYYSTSSTSRV